MSRLTVIRHAQASLMKADYDQLSDLGKQQSAALANYLVAQQIRFDHLYLGTLKRHQQTADFICEAWQAKGWTCPITHLIDLNEHQSPKVARWMLERALSEEQHEALIPIRKTLATVKKVHAKSEYLAIFDQVAVLWATASIDTAPIGVEPFYVFRNRVEKVLKQIQQDSQSGQHIGIVTSGGPSSVSVGLALELTDAKVMELNGMVRNSAFTDFLFDKNRFSLSRFNATPHLRKGEWLTLV